MQERRLYCVIYLNNKIKHPTTSIIMDHHVMRSKWISRKISLKHFCNVYLCFVIQHFFSEIFFFFVLLNLNDYKDYSFNCSDVFVQLTLSEWRSPFCSLMERRTLLTDINFKIKLIWHLRTYLPSVHHKSKLCLIDLKQNQLFRLS